MDRPAIRVHAETHLDQGRGSMNLRRLKYFVKIVDIGSLTQAADMLHIAQPALSQQLATLEGEVRQQLLLRTKRGVTPTEAGKVLYRHAQLILRQCEQARVDMNAAGRGSPARCRSAWRRARPRRRWRCRCLRTVRARHPGVLLYLNETYGTTLSELDHERPDGPGRALRRQDSRARPVVPAAAARSSSSSSGPTSMPAPPEPVPLRMLGEMDLYLARPYNVVRKMVDEAFAGERA